MPITPIYNVDVTQEDVYDMIDIVIDNAYFVLGDKVYRKFYTLSVYVKRK